jgi:CheY-like chemotaxis protein
METVMNEEVGREGLGSQGSETTVVRKVLIVDDNTALAENVAEMLQLAGHTTQVAASAEEAFPRALESEPDVVVTDFRLPGMSGAQFVRQFLATRANIRAMVISAYTDDATIEEASAAGAVFMAKPLDLVRLSGWVGDAQA